MKVWEELSDQHEKLSSRSHATQEPAQHSWYDDKENVSAFIIIDPGITSGLGKAVETSPSDSGKKNPVSSDAAKTDDDQFSMDIWVQRKRFLLQGLYNQI